MKVSSFLLTDVNKIPAVIFTISKETPNEQKRTFLLTENGITLLRKFALEELGLITGDTVMELIWRCQGRTWRGERKCLSQKK